MLMMMLMMISRGLFRQTLSQMPMRARSLFILQCLLVIIDGGGLQRKKRRRASHSSDNNHEMI
ncbi:MAG: hypothetical protein MHMPM18_001972 [Marteilia pararefringens]